MAVYNRRSVLRDYHILQEPEESAGGEQLPALFRKLKAKGKDKAKEAA